MNTIWWIRRDLRLTDNPALHSALELGSADMDWIKNLLAHHNIPAESLHGYVAAYSQAAEEVMGRRAKEFTVWLATQ